MINEAICGECVRMAACGAAAAVESIGQCVMPRHTCGACRHSLLIWPQFAHDSLYTNANAWMIMLLAPLFGYGKRCVSARTSAIACVCVTFWLWQRQRQTSSVAISTAMVAAMVTLRITKINFNRWRHPKKPNSNDHRHQLYMYCAEGSRQTAGDTVLHWWNVGDRISS